MGFSAGKAATSLDYDFTDGNYADEQTSAILADAKGSVPEPTQDRLDGFTHALRQLATDPDIAELASLGSDPDPQQVVAVLATVPEEKLQGVNDAMLQAVIDLCAGSPSEQQIRALPPRIRTAFIGWLSGELVGPTGPTPDSGRSLVATPNGAGPGT